MEVQNDYSSVEAEALTSTEKISSSDISDEKCKKSRKLFFNETRDNEINLKGKEKIITETVSVICHTIIVQLQSRGEFLKKTVDLCCMFFDRSIDENVKSHYSKKLSEFYQEDIDINLFEDEVKHLIHFIENDEVCASRSPVDLYRLLESNLEVFSQFYLAFTCLDFPIGFNGLDSAVGYTSSFQHNSRQRVQSSRKVPKGEVVEPQHPSYQGLQAASATQKLHESNHREAERVIDARKDPGVLRVSEESGESLSIFPTLNFRLLKRYVKGHRWILG
ncbi:unnamed protein product [Caretta caretta]